MKYLSLFTGIGGFELGIQQAYDMGIKSTNKECGQTELEVQQWGVGATLEMERGILPTDKRRERSVSCVGFSEVDKYAIQIYQKHFPNHKNYGNITTIIASELPDFDFLCGGFPCQAFSIAGKRRGFDDTRGTLFFDIARILKEKRPRLFLLENVKGLLSHDNGNTFKTIISTLTELGYDLQWQVLNSKNHGVPQNRERVFIIGHTRGTSRPQVFPFGDTNEIDIKSEQKLSEQISNTLRTNYGGGYSNETYALEEAKIRRLTPTECERLQGFEDGWTEGVSDTQRYKTLGNAVTVNVIRDIMIKLLSK